MSETNSNQSGELTGGDVVQLKGVVRSLVGTGTGTKAIVSLIPHDAAAPVDEELLAAAPAASVDVALLQRAAP